MCEAIVVHELHGVAELITNVPYLVHRIGIVVVIFHKIKNTQSEQIKYQTNMTVKIKIVQQLNNQMSPFGIPFHEFLEHIDL